jgi:hypothetical protein
MSYMGHSMTASLRQPESLALRAFGFIANDRTNRDRFLSLSGLSSADLMRQPVCVEYLTAILDFLIRDEKTLQEFVRMVDVPPEAAYEARRVFGNLSSQSHALGRI